MRTAFTEESPLQEENASPRPALSVIDGIAIVVGVVIGAGIFKTPSLVAANVGSPGSFLGVWLLGGFISLVGALCYAELAISYPHAGGDYHFLRRAFGGHLSFLFAWARLTVIQTGSIAVQAFLIGDYASSVLSLGEYSSSIYAALVVLVLTGLNVAGLQQGKWTQNLLTSAVVLGLLLVIVGGLSRVIAGAPAAAASAPGASGAVGLAMVFVLLTYGGWNEAAYLSAEVRGRRGILHVLLWGIGIITVIYLLANLAFLVGLGMPAMAKSEVVAADLMRGVLGDRGADAISLIIMVAALSTINATIFTGARTNYAWGRDVSLFRFMGRWQDRANTPANALLTQGLIALGLVALGTATRGGFTTMVEYTAPVFWFFFLLVGVSLLVLRRKEPDAVRGFRVPLYPVTPLLFCAICLYMLRSSLLYTGLGAWVGVAVLLAGVPLLLLANSRPVAQQQTARERV